MPGAIEDYALIGDTQTAALVGRDGSIDWLCLPRFDSNACFAALLGKPEHGCWKLAPSTVLGGVQVRRRYRPDSLILETEFTTPEGVVRVVDCMPPRDRVPDIVRVVEGVRGRVSMHMQLVIRFDYGSVVPWVTREQGEMRAVAGPDALSLAAPVAMHGHHLTTVADFTVSEGQRIPFVLRWHPSHEPAPVAMDALEALADTEAWWKEWFSHCTYQGAWPEAVRTSLMTLKALTYAPTGGIVAAATTSLPEQLGGMRNWDYRFCWLRDATFTLYALTLGGFREEAEAWRSWLMRSVAGDPSQLQIMYGVAGERRLTERTVPWLPGYQGSKPVRTGNAAVDQFQLDVYGEVMDALHQANRIGLHPDPRAWDVALVLMDFLESAWVRPDAGMWEVRGDLQHFTYSKVMAWVAFDRAVKTVERFGANGPVEHWRQVRDAIHREICERAWDPRLQSFTQAYGSRSLDASLLLLPLVGFLPPRDPRMVGTVRAIERELLEEGLVRRYHTHQTDDGLPPGEGRFIACSFWLADNYVLQGRREEAEVLFERLLALRNDVGLLAEEYDPVARRQLGNFPQAFSHVGLINTAFNLQRHRTGPALHRRENPVEPQPTPVA